MTDEVSQNENLNVEAIHEQPSPVSQEPVENVTQLQSANSENKQDSCSIESSEDSAGTSDKVVEISLQQGIGTENQNPSPIEQTSDNQNLQAQIVEPIVNAEIPSASQVEEQQTAHLCMVEALVFAHGEPISKNRLIQVSGLAKERLLEIIELLKARYQDPRFGIELVEIAEQYQFRTKADFSKEVRELKGSAPRRLSAAALETLAIVAYRQPIVRSDIESIRGVDVTPTIKTLLERSLIKIVGHQPTVGNPALFGTTDEFLKLFGLRTLSELPTLRDLKELESEPGEDKREAESEDEEEGRVENADDDRSQETQSSESQSLAESDEELAQQSQVAS